jgi:hypothetical protein
MTREEIRARFTAIKKEIDEYEAFIAKAHELEAAGLAVDAEAARFHARRGVELLEIIRELRSESALERATRLDARARERHPR